jgi:DNA-binding NarL/FixJ family response regulator
VTTGPIRVLVVDDDPMVRASLRVMLGGHDDIEIVSLLGDGDEITPAHTTAAHVILMDVVMARVDGLTATARITARNPHPAVIILTTFDADDHILEALRVGAAGFLLKDTTPEQLVEGIRRVAAGEPMLSASVTRRLMSRVRAEVGAQAAARSRLAGLSPREAGIARMIGRGMSNSEIAAESFLSVATVKTHIGQIFTKLGLNSRVQVALLVHEAGSAHPGERGTGPVDQLPGDVRRRYLPG